MTAVSVPGMTPTHSASSPSMASSRCAVSETTRVDLAAARASSAPECRACPPGTTQPFERRTPPNVTSRSVCAATSGQGTGLVRRSWAAWAPTRCGSSTRLAPRL